MPATLDPELVQSLTAAAREVLETMAAMPALATAAAPAPTVSVADEVVGLLGFTGSQCGTFVVRASDRLARAMVGGMLMQAPEQLSFDEAADGFGELVNMIGGSFKNTWVGRGHRMDLSVPHVIHRGTVRLDGKHGHALVGGVRLQFAAGELLVAVLFEAER